MRIPIAFLLLVPSVCFSQANTIEMQGGDLVEWVSVKDAGENVEVRTDKGVRMIKKVDIKNISVSPPKSASIVPSGPINLLTKVDVEKNTMAGNWRIDQKGLTVVSANVQSKIVFPVNVPDEYELSVVLEKRCESDWGGDFCFGLLGGGRQFTATIGGDEGAWDGFDMADGLHSGKNGTLFPKKQGPRLITFLVSKGVLSMSVDGKVLSSIKPDYEKMGLSPQRAIPEKNRLFLVTSKWGVGGSPASWTISRMTLTPLVVALVPPK
jgi:hypothetical protein